MDLTQTRSHGFRPRPDVEIRTSTRRRKTAGARWEGDKVVVAANFLIDAESNLRAALQGFSDGAKSQSSQQGATP